MTKKLVLFAFLPLTALAAVNIVPPSGGGSGGSATNAQPPSANLTNWSSFSTNVVSTTASNAATALNLWTNDGGKIELVGSYSTLSNVSLLNANARGTSLGLNSLTNREAGNVAAGRNAMGASPDCYQNTGVGDHVLEVDTSVGAENAAFGYYSMNHNVSGFYNAAFGEFSMLGNVSGVDNAAFGKESLSNNISGNDNSAFGSQSLLFTKGDENTAIGNVAMRENITGSRNTAVGKSALKNITGSDENVATGESAGTGLTVGLKNSYFGKGSGVSSHTGTNVTLIGANTGVGGSLVNATALGADTIVSTDNTVQLGNTAVTNANTSGRMNATNGFQAYAASSIPTNTAAFNTIAPVNLHSVTLGKGWTNDLGARADLVLSVKYVDSATGDPALAFTNSITGEAWTNSVAFGLAATIKDTIVIPDLSPNDRGSFTDLSGAGATVTILNAWWKLK